MMSFVMTRNDSEGSLLKFRPLINESVAFSMIQVSVSILNLFFVLFHFHLYFRTFYFCFEFRF